MENEKYHTLQQACFNDDNNKTDLKRLATTGNEMYFAKGSYTDELDVI